MFPKLSLDENWVVSEHCIDRENLRFQETIFTLGNGYLGARGILEEGYVEGYAGTYIAGVYDRDKGQSFELVNAPNPLSVEIYVNGKKLSMNDMEVIEHHRALDMRKAVLVRHTVFRYAGERYEYESMRFFSLRDMHTGVLTFSFKSLDGDAHVVVRCAIDGATRNEVQAMGSPIKHYIVTHTLDCGNSVLYLESKTNDLGIVIGMASGYEVVTDVAVKSCVDGKSAAREFSFNARKGKRYKFNEYISIYTSLDVGDSVKAACLNEVETAREYGIPRLLKRHTRAWNKRWQYSDISIEGDSSAQKALRFDMYHLLIAAPPRDIDVSIAAKALSGEWYKGHIFWDTEIYALPFFIYTQPGVAREFLIYRYRRLNHARDRARAQSYKGALWPWESAASGGDETPQTWVNFDGTVIPVCTPEREHHIAGDVIYGVFLYYQVTGDEDFMLRYGAEMIFETARFWASRVVYDKQSGQYGIGEVIGPNEFQECVNNNSYTNALARWTLRYASELYHYFDKRHPKELETMARKIGLTDREVDTWKEIAEKIVFLARPDGLIEEFEGYFGRKDVTINEWDENGMPIWPSG
jgi:Trehalose and maltose hydrolases (possible phosphorylases)